ncbi:hypothetical protein FOA52_002162 [Chlamydomonas sp. UWO 241]|nr:hypothetical protein FOA52_002162 [Chlamydomonas sp. UWO 241]
MANSGGVGAEIVGGAKRGKAQKAQEQAAAAAVVPASKLGKRVRGGDAEESVAGAAIDPEVDPELASMMAAGFITADDLLTKAERRKKASRGVKGVKGAVKPSDWGRWDTLGEWAEVDTGDDIIKGSSDGGFAGLEVLDGAVILDEHLFGAKPKAARKEKEGGPKRKGKEGQAAAGADAAAAGTKRKQVGKDSGSVLSLLERLSALEAENAALRKQQGGAGQPKAAKALSGAGAGGSAAAGRPAKKAKSGAAAGEEGGKGEEEEAEGAEAKPSKAVARELKQQHKARMKASRAARKVTKKEARAEADAVAEVLAAGRAGAPAGTDGPSGWHAFNLHAQIEGALAALGFHSPTAIQAAVLPAAVVSRSDVIGAAQTGSGKTLAFGLPIIQVLLQEREALAAAGREDPHAGKLRALVLCPTRELALQVAQHLTEVSKPCGVRVAAIVGGLAQVKQERVLSLSPQVVVATPGRLWELMREGQPLLSDFSHLSFLVLDEADRMLAQGHFQELTSILDQIPRQGQARANTYDPDFEEAFAAETGRRREGKTGKEAKRRKGAEEEKDEGVEAEDEGVEAEDEEADEVPSASASAGHGAAAPRTKGQLMQTMVFSATLTLPANLRKRLRAGGGGSGGGASLESLIDRMHFRGDPRIVDLTTTTGSKLVSTVRESYLNCTQEERDEVMYYLLVKHPGRTIVFVNAVSTVRRLAALLKLMGLPVSALHAQQQQRQRLKAVDRFKGHPQGILVATDVAARGLDIKGVRCVVHYQLPATTDTYIHRSGRTARAGEDGVIISLVTPKDAPRWSALTRTLGRTESLPTFPLDRTVMPQVHKRVRLAMRLDDMLRIDRKARAESAWMATNAEAIGVDLEDAPGSHGGGSAASRGDAGDADDGDDGDNRVASSGPSRALQAELAQLLALPLTPRLSAKFVTGGAGAAAARSAGLLAADTADPRSHSAVPAGTLSAVLAMARELQASKDAARCARAGAGPAAGAKPTASKPDGGAAGAGADAGVDAGEAVVAKRKVKKQPPPRRASATALARELLRQRDARKRSKAAVGGRRGGGLSALPAAAALKKGPQKAPVALARGGAGGPGSGDALEALQRKLAGAGMPKLEIAARVPKPPAAAGTGKPKGKAGGAAQSKGKAGGAAQAKGKGGGAPKPKGKGGAKGKGGVAKPKGKGAR